LILDRIYAAESLKKDSVNDDLPGRRGFGGVGGRKWFPEGNFQIVAGMVKWQGRGEGILHSSTASGLRFVLEANFCPGIEIRLGRETSHSLIEKSHGSIVPPTLRIERKGLRRPRFP
jgi:hypothetical protein